MPVEALFSRFISHLGTFVLIQSNPGTGNLNDPDSVNVEALVILYAHQVISECEPYKHELLFVLTQVRVNQLAEQKSLRFFTRSQVEVNSSAQPYRRALFRSEHRSNVYSHFFSAIETARKPHLVIFWCHNTCHQNLPTNAVTRRRP